jgi:sulfate transport system permease protein
VAVGSAIKGLPSHRRYHGVGTPARSESPVVRRTLIFVAALFWLTFLVAPLAVVFHAALSEGFEVYVRALSEPETMSALRLTLLAAFVAVPLNTVFGVAVAWLISKYDFLGKTTFLTLVDLPFSVSPVIAGLLFVLLFGSRGWFAPLLESWDVRVIFAVPGVVLATMFITAPMIAREVLAVMDAQGKNEEEAALTLGASGWHILWTITIPKVKWGLLYGVILCNARAMGEFGAVSVVSGHIRGETNTLPLHVEVLYNEYQFAPAFAVASLLALVAVITLVLKNFVEWRAHRRAEQRTIEEVEAPLPSIYPATEPTS